MSDAIFPASLPPPLAAGYKVERGELTSSMDTDAGKQRVRPRFRSAPAATSFSWKFTAAQYQVFRAFYKNELSQGTKSFLCPLSDGIGGLNAVLVFFLEPPSKSVDDGFNWIVSAKVLTTGPALGKFPRLVNVAGATGGDDGETGGPGGGQDPVREIHLTNFTLTSPGQAHVGIFANGKLAISDASGTQYPAGLWKVATNTTPTNQYSFSSTLTVLEYRDGGMYGPNNPDIYSQPPTTYNANPTQNQELSVPWKDQDVPSILSDRRISMGPSSYHPWIKYLLTVRVKDMTSGHQSIGLFTVTVGVKPSGRQDS